jgi:hypothetical protein
MEASESQQRRIIAAWIFPGVIVAGRQFYPEKIQLRPHIAGPG